MGLWDKRDDMIVHEADPYNAEPSRGALADRMLTPIDSFYGRTHGPIPFIDPQEWRLRVGGLVEHDLELSLDDLRGQFAQRRHLVHHPEAAAVSGDSDIFAVHDDFADRRNR